MAQKMELRSAVGKMKAGDCHGWWEEGHRACTSCAVREHCRHKTNERKQKEAEKTKTGETGSRAPKMTPMDYLYKALNGRFGKCVRKDAVRSVTDVFCSGSKNVVAVSTSKATGKIKIKSAKGERTFDELSSNKQVDEVLKELVG